MRHIYFLVCLLSLFCQGAIAQSSQPTYPLKVSSNGYTGWLVISGQVNFFFFQGDTTLAISPDKEGAYYLNSGASIGGGRDSVQTSYIYLYFNKAGQLDSISPKGAASIGQDGKSLRLNTASIDINPGRFNREWYPSFGVKQYEQNGFYLGKQTVQLIKGLTYHIDNAKSELDFNSRCKYDSTTKKCKLERNYHGSYFYFTVKNNGTVALNDSNRASAIVQGNHLKFRTVCVMIDPNEISEGIVLTIPKPNSQVMSIPRKKRLLFIRGVVSDVRWLNPKNGNIQFFHILPM
jgi:hypothetical protein